MWFKSKIISQFNKIKEPRLNRIEKVNLEKFYFANLGMLLVLAGVTPVQARPATSVWKPDTQLSMGLLLRLRIGWVFSH